MLRMPFDSSEPGSSYQSDDTIASSKYFEKVFSDLRFLTSLKQQQACQTAVSAQVVQQFSNMRARVEFTLLCQRDAGLATKSYYATAFCDAALTYTHCVLRRYNPQRPILSGLVSHLQNQLMVVMDQPAAKREAFQNDDCTLLIWMLCIGWSVTANRDQKDWFATRLDWLITNYCVEAREHLKAVLYVHAWTEQLSIPEAVFYE